MQVQRLSWTFFLSLALLSGSYRLLHGGEFEGGRVVWWGQGWGQDMIRPADSERHTNGAIELDDEMLTNAVAIAAKNASGLVVSRDGKVFAFGFVGQSRPALGSLTNIAGLQVEGNSFWAIRRDGTVTRWGGDPDAGHVVSSLSNVASVAWIGNESYVALRKDGALYSFVLEDSQVDVDPETGVLIDRQTGLRAQQEQHAPARLIKVNGHVLTNIVGLAGHRGGPVVLDHSGIVFELKPGEGSALPAFHPGPPFEFGSAEPVVVNGSALTNVTAIAGGDGHFLALKRDGKVVAWGTDVSGETRVPDGLDNVVAIAAGEQTSLTLKHDGTVSAWGGNSMSQSAVPAGLSNVVAIAAGGWFSMALTTGAIPESVHTYPHGRIEEMERPADVIFKGHVLSTTESTNNTLFPYWAKTHATRFSTISVLKGALATNEVVFWHITHPPGVWGGGSPPDDHQFEVGRPYIVFARTMENPDYLYTPPADAKDRAFEFRQIYLGGVVRTLDERPVTAATVKEVHWSELNLLLNDNSPSNQLYAIGELDRFSKTCGRDDEWNHSNDFKRQRVLEAIRPLIHNANDAVAILALGCFRLGSACSNIAEPHISELIQVADKAPSVSRRLAAIGTFADLPNPAVSNSLPRWLHDTNREIRAAAIMLLTRYDGDFQEQALKVGAQDSAAMVRTAVVNAIGEARVAALIPTLKQLFTASAGSNTPVKPLTKDELEGGSYYAGGGYIVGDPDYPNVNFGYPPANLGDVHTSAGFALLRFEAAQVADILKTNLNDPGFRLQFLCKLSELGAGPWMEDMATIMDRRLEREKQKAVSRGADPAKYRPTLSGGDYRCWKIMFGYLSDLPGPEFSDGKMDRYLKVLEDAGSTGSQEPTQLYKLYKQKGLKDRAKALREASRMDSWTIQFFDKIDAENQTTETDLHQ